MVDDLHEAGIVRMLIHLAYTGYTLDGAHAWVVCKAQLSNAPSHRGEIRSFRRQMLQK
jgi:hypothetical protein